MFKISQLYKYLFVFSGVLLLASAVLLLQHGLKFGIDFKGGSVTEYAFQTNPDVNKISEAVKSKGFENAQIQTAGEKNLIIRTENLDQAAQTKLLETVRDTQPGEFTTVKFESIGPTMGQELRKKALTQLALVSLAIIAYISYAFRKVQRPFSSWQFGLAAVIALLHDLMIVLGVFALLGRFWNVEIDSMFITALLTVLGFSVHDTIVVFDRLRENMRLLAGKGLSLTEIVNHSISQTLVRSLNTSLTVLLVLLALLLFGGQSIFYFVLALFIGILVGTYSSIFVATPLLLLWQRWRHKRT